MSQSVIDYFVPILAPEVIQEIQSYFVTEKIPKNTLFVKEGDLCSKLYYIDKGLVKNYFIEDEKEIVTWFVYDGMYFSQVDSLLENKPTRYNLYTIEDTEVQAIHVDDLFRMAEKFPEFNRLILKVMYKILNASIDKGLITQSFSATTRYQTLMKTAPEIAKRVPLKDIASFLGISQETLSRIRKKMSKGSR